MRVAISLLISIIEIAPSLACIVIHCIIVREIPMARLIKLNLGCNTKRWPRAVS